MESDDTSNRPPLARILKEVAWFLAVLGIYFFLSIVVLPRLGFNT